MEEPINQEQKEMACETHLFTTLRYKHESDAGFSGNVAMLCHAVEHSDKVLDEDLKLLAKSLLASVINHKVIKHSTEDIKKAYADKQKADAESPPEEKETPEN